MGTKTERRRLVLEVDTCALFDWAAAGTALQRGVGERLFALALGGPNLSDEIVLTMAGIRVIEHGTEKVEREEADCVAG